MQQPSASPPFTAAPCWPWTHIFCLFFFLFLAVLAVRELRTVITSTLTNDLLSKQSALQQIHDAYAVSSHADASYLHSVLACSSLLD